MKFPPPDRHRPTERPRGGKHFYLKGTFSMAGIKTSALISDIRGSVGGNTFARNKAGLYVRARVKPSNPRSTLQQQRRAQASAATAAWGALSAQQRADWQAYAVNTSWTNRLGDSINIGGEAAFVRLSCSRLLAALALPTDAPDEYGHAGGTIATITAVPSTQIITLADPTAGWLKETVDAQLMVFESMPQSGGREMMPSRWSYMQTIVGAAVPETFPFPLQESRWTFVEDQRMGIGMVHIDPTDRVSVRTFAFCIAAE